MLRLLTVGLCVAVCSISFGQDSGYGGGYGNSGPGGYGKGSQRAQKEQHPDEIVVPRIYRVSDLVLPTQHYAFEGVRLPGLESPTMIGGGGGMGGGMPDMGGMGGMPGMM